MWPATHSSGAPERLPKELWRDGYEPLNPLDVYCAAGGGFMKR